MDEITHVMNAHVTVFPTQQNVQSIRWEFRRSDPYAVHMFAPGPFGTEIEWAFSRDILVHALESDDEPLSGAGDVMASADETDLVLYLTSPEGTAALIFRAAEIEAFVTDTYNVIPQQGEADAFGGLLDGFLADVLGYTPDVVQVDDIPKNVPTKELFFPMSGLTYTVPADSPADLAEWEAELLHGIYAEDTDTATEE